MAAVPGVLVASKCLPQFTCGILFTNRQQERYLDLITLQLLTYK